MSFAKDSNNLSTIMNYVYDSHRSVVLSFKVYSYLNDNYYTGSCYDTSKKQNPNDGPSYPEGLQKWIGWYCKRNGFIEILLRYALSAANPRALPACLSTHNSHNSEQRTTIKSCLFVDGEQLFQAEVTFLEKNSKSLYKTLALKAERLEINSTTSSKVHNMLLLFVHQQGCKVIPSLGHPTK